MEIANSLWHLWGALWNLAASFFLAGWLFWRFFLPEHLRNPFKMTITCRECSWEYTVRDYGKEKTSMRAMDKATAKHQEHFRQAHPEQKWEVKTK